MGKHRRQATAERAYERIAYTELTAERTRGWVLHAGVTNASQCQRPTDGPATDVAGLDKLSIQAPAPVVDASASAALGLRCGTCAVASFASLEEQHAHFKSDWHCLNLKRKAKGSAILTLEEATAHFETKRSNKNKQRTTTDHASAEASSSSQSSGTSSSSSDDEEEELELTKASEPVVEFADDRSVFKIYKQILPQFDAETFNPYSSLTELMQSKGQWAVLLLRSGRFAGAVFDKDKALCHKTFQRYTTRRKQGGSQAAHDAGGKAKSAGATLRRYNEAALKQDVANVLTEWKGLLDQCELVFLSSGKRDRSTFFEGKIPTLTPTDARLRRIPFMTFRPTFEEACRVRAELASVRFAPLSAATPVKAAQKAKTQSKQSSSTDAAGDGAEAEAAVVEEEKPAYVPPLVEMVLNGDLDGAKKSLAATEDEIDVNEVDETFMSPLHHAAQKDWAAMINVLLEHGANPSLLDLRSRPAYLLCQSKEARNAFRRFMAEHPDAWDYAPSQISSALTDDMEQKRKEKEAEKRRRARERKKQQKKEAAEQQAIEARKQEEREKEIAAGLACDLCGQYAGKSPLRRLEFKYCSTDCVNNHRRQLMSEAALRRLGG